MIISKKQLKELNQGKAIEVEDFYLERGFPRTKKMRISVKKTRKEQAEARARRTDV